MIHQEAATNFHGEQVILAVPARCRGANAAQQPDPRISIST
jgi:hypothetical protein